jgi:hypothetical protein
MNQEELPMSSGYEASSTEIQSLILQWAKATDAFHYRYAKLNDVINRLGKKSGRQSSTSRADLNRLQKLRQQMGDALMTLLLDMDMSGSQSGRSMLPSKPGQLRSHASVLNEMSRRIDVELIFANATTVAQA